MTCINAACEPARHSVGMQITMPSDWSADACTFPAGTQLMQRASIASDVLYIDSGRVALGLLENGEMVHQLGTIEGPSWLNASYSVLGRPSALDAVAETTVHAHRISLQQFGDGLSGLSSTARTVLHDVAQAHWLQEELAVSRLAKDAEARCAEWLLRHAEPAEGAPDRLAVPLRQRKRMIAAQLGIAPETFSRVLRHLRERQLISGSGRTLNLINPHGLRTLAGA